MGFIMFLIVSLPGGVLCSVHSARHSATKRLAKTGQHHQTTRPAEEESRPGSYAYSPLPSVMGRPLACANTIEVMRYAVAPFVLAPAEARMSFTSDTLAFDLRPLGLGKRA